MIEGTNMTEPLSATIVADDVVGRQLATDDDAVDAMTGARWFVTLVFCLIGISF